MSSYSPFQDNEKYIKFPWTLFKQSKRYFSIVCLKQKNNLTDLLIKFLASETYNTECFLSTSRKFGGVLFDTFEDKNCCKCTSTSSVFLKYKALKLACPLKKNKMEIKLMQRMATNERIDALVT